MVAISSHRDLLAVFDRPAETKASDARKGRSRGQSIEVVVVSCCTLDVVVTCGHLPVPVPSAPLAHLKHTEIASHRTVAEPLRQDGYRSIITRILLWIPIIKPTIKPIRNQCLLMETYHPTIDGHQTLPTTGDQDPNIQETWLPSYDLSKDPVDMRDSVVHNVGWSLEIGMRVFFTV